MMLCFSLLQIGHNTQNCLQISITARNCARTWTFCWREFFLGGLYGLLWQEEMLYIFFLCRGLELGQCKAREGKTPKIRMEFVLAPVSAYLEPVTPCYPTSHWRIGREEGRPRWGKGCSGHLHSSRRVESNPPKKIELNSSGLLTFSGSHLVNIFW